MKFSNNEFTGKDIIPLLIENKFNFFFDNSTRILYKNYIGKITLGDIFYSWDYAIHNKLIPKETNGFILDYRKASLDFEAKKHRTVADYYNNHLEIFGNHKIAFLSEEPKDIAILSLFKLQDHGYISKPFTTIEGAINWILYNFGF